MLRSASYIVLSTLAILQGVAGQANHVADKDELFPAIEFDEPGLLKGLPAQTTVSLPQWAFGTVPLGCSQHMTDRCNICDIQVFDVTYSDCAGNPWTLCR